MSPDPIQPIQTTNTEPANPSTNKPQDIGSENTEPQETKQEQDKESAEGFLVVHGATCLCDQSPTPAKLQVTSHNKYYINDNAGTNKMVATTKDNTFMPSNFITCAKDNPTKLCKYTPTAQWSGEPHKIECNGEIPLLDSYELTCPIYHGKITILAHGQQTDTSAVQAQKTNDDACSIFNSSLSEDVIAKANQPTLPYLKYK